MIIINKENNKIFKLLSLPFLAIFYVVDFTFKIINYFFVGFYTVFKPLFIILKYESLGCYYVSYVIFFPIIFIINKIGNFVFFVYKKRRDKNTNLSEMVSQELVNINTDDNTDDVSKLNANFQEEEEAKEEERNNSLFEYIKYKFNEISFVKKIKNREKEQMKALFETLKKHNIRTEQPVAFKYVVRDENNKKYTNYFIAYSKMEVFTYLTNENCRVISIETSKWINLIYGPSQTYVYKMNTKDLIFWLTQLSTYLKSGISLTESVRILQNQMSKSPQKKRLFDSIIYNLTLGESFSSALMKQGRSFPALLTSMIKTAEATGELEKTLDDMADYYTEIEDTRKAMLSAISYPALVMVFSVAVVVFIMLYVIPKFESIYASTNATLNGFTVFILAVSRFLQSNIMNITLIIVLIAIVVTFLYMKVKVIRIALQKFAMKLPVFGKIIIYKEMSIFAKTFSSLLKNNVFITDTINLLTEITNNEIYKNIMFQTIDFIAKGDKISTAFKSQWAVPEVAYYMIVTGESTGELAEMMNKVALYYQTEHRSIVNSLKAYIEPALIVFLAVVVGGIVISIVLPMFGLYQNIQ